MLCGQRGCLHVVPCWESTCGGPVHSQSLNRLTCPDSNKLYHFSHITCVQLISVLPGSFTEEYPNTVGTYHVTTLSLNFS
jgi:hypothetical protein